MRSKSILTAATLAAFFMAGSAMAETGTYMSIFDGPWSTVTNWKVDTNNDGTYDVPSATVKPTAINHVIIATDIDVTGNEAADSLDVQTTKTLDVQTDNTLTIDGTSSSAHTIAGTILLSTSTSTVAFTATNHTLSGAGNIEGSHNDAKITIAGTYDLTNGIVINGSLEIHGLDATPDGRLINNGTVEATHSAANDNTLVLYEGRFSGTGKYKVDTDGATLQVRAGIDDTGMAADFWVGHDANNGGKLDVLEDMVTTGNLIFSRGTIQVAAGKTFSAD